MDIKLKKKKGLKTKHIPYLVLGAILLGLLGLIAFSSNKKTLRVDRNTLNIGVVKDGDFSEYVRITGLVRPITTIQITPLEGGIVEEIVSEEGSIVKKGDVILRLSNSRLNLDILNTEASLAEKENSLRDTRVRMEQEKLNLQQEMAQLRVSERRTKRKYEQYKHLYKEKLVSEEEFLQAEENFELETSRRKLVANRQIQDSIFRSIQVDNMENSLANMRRNMVLTYERLDNLNVKSPIAGQLGSISVVLGQNITSGINLGQVNDLSSYKIQAEVDEIYIDRVSEGLDGQLEREGEVYKVRLRKVYPEVANRKFKTDLFFLDNTPDKIRTGQTYFINLSTGAPDKVKYIPRGSFVQTTGGNWIFVLTPDGSKAVRRSIKIGRQNPKFYELTEGLETGEKVIISSYDLYDDTEELILK